MKLSLNFSVDIIKESVDTRVAMIEKSWSDVDTVVVFDDLVGDSYSDVLVSSFGVMLVTFKYLTELSVIAVRLGSVVAVESNSRR